jgi:ferritin-like metal-binding protein YciE
VKAGPFHFYLETTMATKSRSSRKQSPGAQELLALELQEIHSAETQLSRLLPRLGKAAQADKLRQMFEQRQEQGNRLIEELDSAFDELEQSPGRKKNAAAEGLITDVREHVQELAEGPALDSVLIAGVQKIEHYCVAAWGTARSLAEAVEQQDVVKSMQRALQEGKKMDEALTQLAEKEITPQLLQAAANEDESDDDDDSDDDANDDVEATESNEDEDGKGASPARKRRGGESQRRSAR